MIVIHANDPTTSFLSRLYELREDVNLRLDEKNTNSEIIHSVKNAEKVMMLGHGTEDGLLSRPDKWGRYPYLIDSSHVQFLRNKTCIGIWCFANKFAVKYKLKGLFSGMIISELKEAVENHIDATKEEIDSEMVKFTERLRFCIDTGDLCDVPDRMSQMDDVHSPLTLFNYANLFYY